MTVFNSFIIKTWKTVPHKTEMEVIIIFTSDIVVRGADRLGMLIHWIMNGKYFV